MGEFYLEPIARKDIHEENKIGMETYKQTWVCYPHVKVRAFKNVTDKSEACSFLCNARRTLQSREQQSEITLLHALHRPMYMGEMTAYHYRNKLEEACGP